MNTVAQNVAAVRERIARACERVGRSPGEVRLMAITKTVNVPTIQEAIAVGIDLFGENRVQEALAKYAPRGAQSTDAIERSGIELHMVGSLQRNKARHATDIFDTVQSLDRPQLADALEKSLAATSTTRLLPVYLEVNVTGEASKSGVAPSGLTALADKIAVCPHLRGVGLMTIARFGAHEHELRMTFSTLRELLVRLSARHGNQWRELSMGMTDDFEIAIEEGATLVRIGRAIFGERS